MISPLASHKKVISTTKKPAAVTQSKIYNDAYALQLGAFSDKKNVDKLIDTLRKMHFAAFSKPTQSTSGTLYRVLIGPELNKNKVAVWKKSIDTKLSIKSKIVLYRSIS